MYLRECCCSESKKTTQINENKKQKNKSKLYSNETKANATSKHTLKLCKVQPGKAKLNRQTKNNQTYSINT